MHGGDPSGARRADGWLPSQWLDPTPLPACHPCPRASFWQARAGVANVRTQAVSLACKARNSLARDPQQRRLADEFARWGIVWCYAIKQTIGECSLPLVFGGDAPAAPCESRHKADRAAQQLTSCDAPPWAARRVHAAPGRPRRCAAERG